MEPRAAVTVVLPTRDRPAQLAQALAAARPVLGAGDELLVVDSASADAAAVAAAAAAHGARLVRCDRPGASRARNAGWRAAAHDLVLFTDDDCRPQPGWPDAVAAAFADAAVGFVTGHVEGEGDGVPLSVGTGHGANLAVRRAALAAVGGFDELLGAGAPLRGSEDKDLMRRLLAAGWQGREAPDAVVRHRLWRTRPQALRVVHGYGMGEGALAVKALRSGDPDGRALLRQALWTGSLRQAGRDLRNGYQFGAVAGCLRFAGAARGALRARRLPVRDGVFVG